MEKSGNTRNWKALQFLCWKNENKILEKVREITSQKAETVKTYNFIKIPENGKNTGKSGKFVSQKRWELW